MDVGVERAEERDQHSADKEAEGEAGDGMGVRDQDSADKGQEPEAVIGFGASVAYIERPRCHSMAPCMYLQVFVEMNVSAVVQLNSPEYSTGIMMIDS